MPIFPKRIHPEAPGRIQEFKTRIRALGWDKDDVVTSLDVLFAALDDLAETEIQYYYRRRGTRALISSVCRILACVLGIPGWLLPLLASANPGKFGGYGPFGYAFLAGAASCLVINALFAGTEGHVRFASAQLDLEKLVITTRVRWCEYLSRLHAGRDTTEAGFAIILAYATELHAITLKETARWGENILAELDRYRQSINVKASPGK